MKITVINGNSRHGSTWHCMDLFKNALSKYEKLDITEFILPKDMPHFCMGCFSCFYNGEKTCPHAQNLNPIIEALLNTDLIIITSPVYGFDVSGQLKALLDHLCFMWLSHRPNPKMFNKIGLIITTTAGAGISHASKTIHNSLKYWGVKRLFTFKSRVSAMKWADVTDKKKIKLHKKVKAVSKRIYKAVKKAGSLPDTFFKKFMFKAMSLMMKKNTWNLLDKNHWEVNGWLK